MTVALRINSNSVWPLKGRKPGATCVFNEIFPLHCNVSPFSLVISRKIEIRTRSTSVTGKGR